MKSLVAAINAAGQLPEGVLRDRMLQHLLEARAVADQLIGSSGTAKGHERGNVVEDVMSFTPMLDCSVGPGGFYRWRSPGGEWDIVEVQGNLVTTRVSKILVAMDYPASDPATVLFGREADGRLNFEIGADHVRHLVRTAFFYRDQHDRLRAEGDLSLIAAEMSAMQHESADAFGPDERGLLWPSHEHGTTEELHDREPIQGR